MMMTARHFFPLIGLIVLSQALAQEKATTTELQLSATADLKPALRYTLLVDGKDQKPGNAALYYAKACLARPSVQDRPNTKDDQAKLQLWEQAGLTELPVNNMRDYLKKFDRVFAEVEAGTHCKHCDWDRTPAKGMEAVSAMLPELQLQREHMRWLSLRIRADLAEKKFDDAARNLRTALQYARHFTERPSLVEALVGLAMTSIVLARVEEFISQPEAPSLYWALSVLPSSYTDLRSAMDGEEKLIEELFPGFAELQTKVVTNERAKEVLEQVFSVFQSMSNSNDITGLGQRFVLTSYIQLEQAKARKELATRGWSAKDVEAMPAAQAVFLGALQSYTEISQDYRKWFARPHVESFDALVSLRERVKRLEKEKKNDPLSSVLLLLLPALDKTHQAVVRTDRKIALLRTIEAMRVHADHNGRWPKELNDIRLVPVPVDPLTNKPHQYELTDGIASITMLARKDGTGPTRDNVYKLKLR
jgi:hypothetical protein